MSSINSFNQLSIYYPEYLTITFIYGPVLTLGVLNAVLFIQNGKYNGINRYLIYPVLTEPVRIILNTLRAGQDLAFTYFVTRCFRIPNCILINLFVVNRILAVAKTTWINNHRRKIQRYYRRVAGSIAVFYFCANVVNYVNPAAISSWYEQFKLVINPSIGFVNLAADVYFLRILSGSISYQGAIPRYAFLAYLVPIGLNLFYLSCKLALQFNYYSPGDSTPLSRYDDYGFASLTVEMYLALNVTKLLVEQERINSSSFSGSDSSGPIRTISKQIRRFSMRAPANSQVNSRANAQSTTGMNSFAMEVKNQLTKSMMTKSFHQSHAVT
jgi:hypothetical protein